MGIYVYFLIPPIYTFRNGPDVDRGKPNARGIEAHVVKNGPLGPGVIKQIVL